MNHIPPPPFDVELAEVLDAVRDQIPPLTSATIPERRQPSALLVLPDDDELARGGRIDVQHHAAPGQGAAPPVDLLECRPIGLRRGSPVVYFIHGGGMVFGTNRLGVTEAVDWAESLGLVVVSVEYRLAPEHPHPAPLDDCYGGLTWVANHADDLSIDSSRIVVVGSSAGGGLAAAMTLLARDRGGPSIAGTMLLSPMLDDRNTSVSARQMEGLGVWDLKDNETGWEALLGGERGGTRVSPYAAAARAVDLSGLPPTFIDVGSAETFRDEDVDFARRIWESGGSAELHVWQGGFHAFDTIAPDAVISMQAREARVRWLNRLLG